MPDVDRWVVENTLRQVASQPDTLQEIDYIAIKISTQSISDDTFIAYIQKELLKTKVDANKVCFEITEGMGINNLSDTANFIQSLKSIGCQCVLDDFGGGASSYRYLKQLPFDALKIDGNFILHIQTNNNDYAVVKSICEVAHFMNKQVTAEFIENEDTLKRTLVNQNLGHFKPYYDQFGYFVSPNLFYTNN